jgi:hypothetical protein
MQLHIKLPLFGNQLDRSCVCIESASDGQARELTAR